MNTLLDLEPLGNIPLIEQALLVTREYRQKVVLVLFIIRTQLN